MSTTTELSSEFPFNPDMIGGDVLGVGEGQIISPRITTSFLLLTKVGRMRQSEMVPEVARRLLT